MPRGVHQCLVYSLAMLLDEDISVLIQELGHDGMDRVFDGPIPHCYNGHHIQEIVDVCITRGLSLTPVDYYPRYASALAPQDWRPLYSESLAAERFERLLTGRQGILIGQYQGQGHAVAWDGNIIWDPNGLAYKLNDFRPQQAWILPSHQIK